MSKPVFSAYLFKKPELLRQALTHRSHGANNNERLEFLGDGVLDCVIATLLYRNFPNLPEGDLSRLRSHLVKESPLSELARKLELGSQLHMGEGEVKTRGWERPSVLADALEALIGAIYLDGGFLAAEGFITELYAESLNKLNPQTLGKDPKTLLQETLQARKIALPQYTVVETSGEAHNQTFCVACVIPSLNIRTQGTGGSRRAAEQEAADAAYREVTKS